MNTLSIKEINIYFDMKKIVQPVYDVFSRYKISQPIETCPCCYSEEIHILSTKYLIYLTVEDIGIYPHKALTTWGGQEDFKYLLPRMLELEVYKSPYAFHYIPSKLGRAEFNDWPKIERTTLETFFARYFIYLLTINEGYHVEDLVKEIRTIMPNFLVNNREILNAFTTISYQLLDYNSATTVNDNDYFSIIYNAFGEEAAIEYILNWPEDIKGILKFSKLINSFLYHPCIAIPRTKSKLKRMQHTLEKYWFKLEGKCNPIVTNEISNAVLALDYLILIQ